MESLQGERNLIYLKLASWLSGASVCLCTLNGARYTAHKSHFDLILRTSKARCGCYEDPHCNCSCCSLVLLPWRDGQCFLPAGTFTRSRTFGTAARP